MESKILDKKKNLIILPLIILAVMAIGVFIFSSSVGFSFFEPKISGKELAKSFGEIDSTVEKSSTKIEAFEKIKNSDLSGYSLEAVIKQIDEGATIENFNENNVQGSIASIKDGRIMALRFADSAEAGKYMMALQSQMIDNGHEFTERLQYEEISTSFKISLHDSMGSYTEYSYLLKKGSYIIIFIGNLSAA